MLVNKSVHIYLNVKQFFKKNLNLKILNFKEIFKEKETQMYRIDFWTLWEKARVGCLERTALKHVYYLGWNRSPAQARCMRQMLGPGVLGRPRGIGWRGRQEGGLGWGIHVNPWLIYVNVWQKPLQYCKVISLQLIKINGKRKDDVLIGKKKKERNNHFESYLIDPFSALTCTFWLYL